MVLKVKVNDSIINTSRENHKTHIMCKFGDLDKWNFLEFWVKMANR